MGDDASIDSERASGVEAGAEAEAKSAAPMQLFLVVIDETDEVNQALYYACQRARMSSARVALLYVQEPVDDLQHWIAVADALRHEREAKARVLIESMAAKAHEWSGFPPVLFHQEGDRFTELMNFIDANPNICVLILGSGTKEDSPGPLISSIVSRRHLALPCPLTIVPGHLTFAEVDQHLEQSMPVVDSAAEPSALSDTLHS